MKPLIPWVGGKTRLVKEILRRIPKHTCYVEPFFGGGAVLFAKTPSKAEIVNDINDELVNLYRIVQEDPWRLLAALEWALVSRTRFNKLKNTDLKSLSPLQRAARFFYMTKTCFAGKMRADTSFGTGTCRPPSFNPFSIAGDVVLTWRRLCRAIIENMDYAKLIARYDRPHTFFYVDPPYPDAPGCYEHEFTEGDHRKLADALAATKGKWLLSYNDHPLVRSLYRGFKIDRVETRYSLPTKGRDQRASEVLIRNYPLTSRGGVKRARSNRAE